jgi:uncharacterized protein
MSSETARSNELHEAIKRGDAEAVRTLVAADPGRTASRGPGGESALLLAVYHGRRELLPLLLAHATPHAGEAAAMNDLPLLRAALDAAPAQLGELSGDGWTPLHLAAFFAEEGVAAELLARGAAVDARSTNSTANTPLHAALAGRGDAAVVRRLVEAGADVNARGGAGWTPLHLAASRGNIPLVDYLLSRGADPRAVADDGRDAATIAESRGHAEAAARLRAAVGTTA